MEKFTADPQAGRIAPAVSATLADGRARVSAGPFTWEADLPSPVGGGNQAPSPALYLLGALAACAVTFMADTLAPEFGVEIDELTAEVRSNSDLSGLLGIEGRDPRLKDMTISIAVTSSSAEESVSALRDAWIARCPVYLALFEPNSIDVQFSSSQG